VGRELDAGQRGAGKPAAFQTACLRPGAVGHDQVTHFCRRRRKLGAARKEQSAVRSREEVVRAAQADIAAQATLTAQGDIAGQRAT
jgi:hypothetical protein